MYLSGQNYEWKVGIFSFWLTITHKHNPCFVFFQKLPGLQSFCLYCTIGIFAVFVFQATLFVACVAIDLRRLQQNRNGFLVCYQHKNHSVLPVTDELNFRRKMFRTLGKIINHLWGKVSKKASKLVCNI